MRVTQKQLSRARQRGSAWGWLRLRLLAIATLALLGCSAAPQQGRVLALQRWQAQPVAHYRLSTHETVGNLDCAQIVEVRDEVIEKILANSCKQPSLWTVGWLFRYGDRSQQPAEQCSLSLAGIGCVCNTSVEVQTEYDPVLGFPRSFTRRNVWSAAWQRLGYWVYLAQNLALPNCTSPFNAPSWVVQVRELRPLP